MTNEDYLKKLDFTIESVERGKNHVSGVVEFFCGSCIVFDLEGMEVHDSCGTCLFTVNDLDIVKKVLSEEVCVKDVKRVFPDCC